MNHKNGDVVIYGVTPSGYTEIYYLSADLSTRRDGPYRLHNSAGNGQGRMLAQFYDFFYASQRGKNLYSTYA